MNVGLPGGTLSVSSRSELEEARSHVAPGLDLSRRRVDVCVIDERGEVIAEIAAQADGDGLRRLAGRLRGERVRAVIESMKPGRGSCMTRSRNAAGRCWSRMRR